MTHVDRLIALSEQITACRTANTLDELAATGVITPAERRAFAADEALGTLEGLLRTAELAGHDPAAVLRAAAEERSLDDATSPSQVLLHYRITTRLTGRLTPHLTSAADLIQRLMRGVQRVQVGGEPAHRREPVGPPVRAATWGSRAQSSATATVILDSPTRSRWSRNWISNFSGRASR